MKFKEKKKKKKKKKIKHLNFYEIIFSAKKFNTFTSKYSICSILLSKLIKYPNIFHQSIESVFYYREIKKQKRSHYSLYK